MDKMSQKSTWYVFCSYYSKKSNMDTFKFRSLFPTIFSESPLNEAYLDSHFSELINYTVSHKVKEGEKDWKIEIALPGVSKKDISVSLKESDKLTVEVSKESKRYSGLIKKFKLSTSCDREAISAESTDGILEIIIPKIESFQDKVVKIK